MGFASEGVHQVGSSVGVPVGMEPVRAPLSEFLSVDGKLPAVLQQLIARLPMQQPSEAAPGMAQDSPRPRPHSVDSGKGAGLQVQPTRRIIPTREERRSWRQGPLTGLLWDKDKDPEQRGTLVEPMEGQAVSSPGMQALPDSSVAFDDTIQTVIHPAPDYTDDLGQHVQSTHHSEPAVMLRSLRHAYPNLPIAPIPQGRCVALTAKDTPTEIQIPDGTVVMRITWSGAFSGVDLLVSFVGNVAAVVGGANNAAAFDGTILNPDPSTFYYVKGKRALSVMVPGASLAFAANTIVSLHCFLNY